MGEVQQAVGDHGSAVISRVGTGLTNLVVFDGGVRSLLAGRLVCHLHEESAGQCHTDVGATDEHDQLGATET